MKEYAKELEEQLEQMPKQKRLFIYISIIVLSVFMSWNLFGEDMNLEVIFKEESIVSLQSKLQKNSIKTLENAIRVAKQDSFALEDDIIKLNFKNQFIRTKFESINFIFFNQVGIAQILDDILKQSLKNSIDIKIINYKDVKVPIELHLVEEEQIEIKGSASFKNIMKLMQYIDNINSLLKVNSVDVYIDENIDTNFNLNISHYGVKL